METAPTCSLLLCTRNRARLLPRLFESLRAQRWPDGVTREMVVVDNGSTDATDAVVATFAATVDYPVRLVREPRPGIAPARNAAVAAARGAVLLWVDDDVRLEPDCLAELLRGLAETGADLLGGRIMLEPERPVPAWLGRYASFLGALDLGDVPIPSGATVWSACMATRRAVFDRLRFDERLGHVDGLAIGGEETRLQGELVAAGGRVGYWPHAMVHHWVPAARLTRRFFFEGALNRARGDMRVLGPPQPGTPRLFGAERWRWGRVVRTLPAGLLSLAGVGRLDGAIDLGWALGWVLEQRRVARAARLTAGR